jgi:pimeloyl-ACP methyl ester carboxylesterase
MKKALGSKNGLGWLCVGLLAGAGAMQGQVPGQRVTLNAAQIVAGESKSIEWPLRETRISSIVSVASSPEIPFPIRVDLGSDGGGQLQFRVPPATPPGDYQLEITGRLNDGRPLRAALLITVAAVTVPRSATGNPPVILMNGWQFNCADQNSTLADSVGTFGAMASALGPSVLFFNNCVYGDIPIEQLAGELAVYIASLTYTDGTPVTQVDLVTHSMGGLIVRAYLAGLRLNGSSWTLAPPLNPRVRKFVEIAGPNFGSFLAADGSLLIATTAQSSEMIPGSAFLFNLATWNQWGDDLRGVDALAVVGDAGSFLLGENPTATDGVVTVTSASLGFAESPSRTVVLPYCHIGPDSAAHAIIPCISAVGIAEASDTISIVLSFLGGTTAWQTIGFPASVNSYLAHDAGLYFTYFNTDDVFLNDVSNVYFGSTALSKGGDSANSVYYDELVPAGSATFQFQSTSVGSLTYGPISAPAGYVSVARSKSSPVIFSVTPLLPNGAGRVVESGTTITINGSGFGSSRCSTCRVLAYPGPVALALSSWSNTAITAFLPSSFNGIAQIVVQTLVPQEDAIDIMASPLATTSPITC